MKVLAINGSARKNGNTTILIKNVFEELEKEGIKTELIELSGEIIEPCKACFACQNKGNCVFKRDRFFEIFEKVKECDGLILASPSYSANVSSTMQALLERMAVVSDTNPSLLTHKVGCSISSSRRAGSLNALDTMNHFFLNHEMFIVGSTYWNFAFGRLIGDVNEDKEGLETMHSLGKNMAFLLKKLQK